jgi:2-polyprenyl-3-methyl-5-hydroxy-6-metoxy-1,4-benzoquinol methylase
LEYLCYLLYVVKEVQLLSPRSVLDVGCGDGCFLGMLGQEIERRVGIDLSERAIRFARAFHPEVEYRCEDLQHLEEAFDVVTAIEVLEHIRDDKISGFAQALFERVHRDGRLIVSVPTTVVPVNRKHYRHYTVDLLQDQMRGARFKLIKADYIYRNNLLFEQVLRLLNNRSWSVNSAVVRRCLWRFVQKRIVKAVRQDGRHLIAVFKK